MENPEKTPPIEIIQSEEDSTVEPQSLEEIKKSIQLKVDGTNIKLPSGLVFRLTKPSISKLLKDDIFPAELISTAIKMDSNTNAPTTKDEYVKSLAIIDEIVIHSAVFPKVVKTKEEVTKESIYVGDVDDQDKVAIFIYVQTGVKPLNSFRSQ